MGARAFSAMSWILVIFCRVGLGQGAAEDGEVLGEHEHLAAVDGAPAGDDAVARNFHALGTEIDAAMLDEHVELLEGVLVHQKVDALAGGELAALVLGVDAPLPAAEPRMDAPHVELFENVLHDVPTTIGPVAPVLARRSGKEECRRRVQAGPQSVRLYRTFPDRRRMNTSTSATAL